MCIRDRAERDYQLASGLSQDVETDDNVFRQTTARLPWLLIGMIGGIGNSMILGNFDSTFAAHPEMALYIPLIGGTGGNVGTQSSAPVSYTHLDVYKRQPFISTFKLSGVKRERYCMAVR